jgi:hypothetical protein
MRTARTYYVRSNPPLPVQSDGDGMMARSFCGALGEWYDVSMFFHGSSLDQLVVSTTEHYYIGHGRLHKKQQLHYA